MNLPEVLLSLTDQGIIDAVLRPLKSGKEAQVYLVRSGGEERVAKVYKDADQRTFKQRAQYTEGRRVRNTRDQRAMERHTRHGKAQEEAAWKSSEVNVIYRLHAQGVRVPTPHNFIDGVLIMELMRGDDGNPAPRLAELAPDTNRARAMYQQLLREVVKMLCAGVVHGDLSEYNVLVDTEGPVVIDFPQSVDAAHNRNARNLLVRDVDNLTAFLRRCVPGAPHRPYGQEIWAAYEANLLTPEMELTGQFRQAHRKTNVGAVMDEIKDAARDEQRRRAAMGRGPGATLGRALMHSRDDDDSAPAGDDGTPRPRKREVIITSASNQRGRGRRPGHGGERTAAPTGQQRKGPGRRGAGAQGRRQQGDGRQGHGQVAADAPRTGRDGYDRGGHRRNDGHRAGAGRDGGGRNGAGRDGAPRDGANRDGGGRDGGGRDGGGRDGAASNGGRRIEQGRRDGSPDGERHRFPRQEASGSNAETRGRSERRPTAEANGSTQRHRADANGTSGRRDERRGRDADPAGDRARPRAHDGGTASAEPSVGGAHDAKPRRRRRRRGRGGGGGGPGGNQAIRTREPGPT